MTFIEHRAFLKTTAADLELILSRVEQHRKELPADFGRVETEDLVLKLRGAVAAALIEATERPFSPGGCPQHRSFNACELPFGHAGAHRSGGLTWEAGREAKA